MLSIRFFFLLFLIYPVCLFCESTPGEYADIKDPYLFAFLTDSFQSISDIKNLPPGIKLQLEQYEKKVMGMDDWGSDGHFLDFKMLLAGKSKSYVYICYQTSHSPVLRHLFLFSEGTSKKEICYDTQIPSDGYDLYGKPVWRKVTLKMVREWVAGQYRDEEKRKKIAADWKGDIQNGWVNLKTSMKIKVTGDKKSVIAYNALGWKLWQVNVIEIAESAGMWKNHSWEGTYPKEINNIRFIEEGKVAIIWGDRCASDFDLKTGECTFTSCL